MNIGNLEICCVLYKIEMAKFVVFYLCFAVAVVELIVGAAIVPVIQLDLGTALMLLEYSFVLLACLQYMIFD